MELHLLFATQSWSLKPHLCGLIDFMSLWGLNFIFDIIFFFCFSFLFDILILSSILCITDWVYKNAILGLTFSWFYFIEPLGAGYKSVELSVWFTWWSAPVLQWYRLLVLFLKDPLCIVLVYKKISRSANHGLIQLWLSNCSKQVFLNLFWLNMHISGERSGANMFRKLYLHLLTSRNSTITSDSADK